MISISDTGTQHLIMLDSRLSRLTQLIFRWKEFNVIVYKKSLMSNKAASKLLCDEAPEKLNAVSLSFHVCKIELLIFTAHDCEGLNTATIYEAFKNIQCIGNHMIITIIVSFILMKLTVDLPILFFQPKLIKTCKRWQ